MTAHTSARRAGSAADDGHRVELLSTNRSPHHLFREVS